MEECPTFFTTLVSRLLIGKNVIVCLPGRNLEIPKKKYGYLLYPGKDSNFSLFVHDEKSCLSWRGGLKRGSECTNCNPHPLEGGYLPDVVQPNQI